MNLLGPMAVLETRHRGFDDHVRRRREMRDVGVTKSDDVGHDSFEAVFRPDSDQFIHGALGLSVGLALENHELIETDAMMRTDLAGGDYSIFDAPGVLSTRDAEDVCSLFWGQFVTEGNNGDQSIESEVYQHWTQEGVSCSPNGGS